MFLFAHSDIQELTLILLLLLQRLSDTEQPWFVTQDYGVDMYNRIGKEALMKFEGIDSGIGWFTMTGKVKSILGDIVRKPRSGWSREHVSKAIDGLTACLVNLICNDEWSNDALARSCLQIQIAGKKRSPYCERWTTVLFLLSQLPMNSLILHQKKLQLRKLIPLALIDNWLS